MTKIVLVLLTLTSCASVIIPTKDKEDLVGLQENFSKEFSVDSTSDEIIRLFPHQRGFKFKQGTLSVDKVGRKLTMILRTDELALTRQFKCQPNGKLTRLWTIRLVPPIVWTINSQSNLILLDKSNRLILYQDSGGVVMLTVLPIFGTSTGQTRTVYEPRDN